MAAIISASDLERLNQLEAQRDERWRVLDEIHARNQDKTPEEVEQDVAEALTEVRQQARQQGTPRAHR